MGYTHQAKAKKYVCLPAQTHSSIHLHSINIKILDIDIGDMLGMTPM